MERGRWRGRWRFIAKDGLNSDWKTPEGNGQKVMGRSKKIITENVTVNVHVNMH